MYDYLREIKEMSRVNIINYAVKGIKNIDRMISLSFYKKTIGRDFDVKGYNLKGIYGANGAGKTGIIASVKILKRLLTEQNYLTNPVIQNELHELINRITNELVINIEYLWRDTENMILFDYEIRLVRNESGQYEIGHEILTRKKALSYSSSPVVCFETAGGRLITNNNGEYSGMIEDQTKNLLSGCTMVSVILGKDELCRSLSGKKNDLWTSVISLALLGSNLYICLDEGDNHSKYHMNHYLYSQEELNINDFDVFCRQMRQLNGRNAGEFTVVPVLVEKDRYKAYEERVNHLYEFLHIFKDDLAAVDIDRKENGSCYSCSLVLNYGDYAVNAEFESTGIKKLIKLYDAFDQMVHGGIVFIDELDSNLHDVYLCALLEYLMENAKGQLCFTTHNVGPMDVLKKNKKSIDFLSADHEIYPWVTNGNYSPANLYKKGMIEGSPFNVFPYEFIKAFYVEGDDE